MISDYPQQLPAGGFHQYHTGGDFNDYQGDQNFSDIFQQGTSFQAGHNAETTDLQSQFQAALAANTERAFVMQQMNASGNFFGDRDMPGLMNQGNVSQRHQQNAFDSNSEFLQVKSSMLSGPPALKEVTD